MKTLDAIDELVARSKQHVELLKFHALHKAHPEILDFIVLEIQLRIDKGLKVISFGSLWDYTRGKLIIDAGTSTYAMNDHATPFYARAILVLHPEFNGRAEFRASRADNVFGLRIAKNRNEEYARRLEWEDGTPLELGWRPSIPHVPKSPANRRPDVHPRENADV